MYWQRVGQHILTKLFWLGGTPGPYPEEDELSKHAWRTTDPLADARVAALKQAGCDGVGIDVSMIRFAELRDLKKAWMEMMSEVEHWLTTGEWEGRQLSPKNSQMEVERMCASKEETALDKSVDEELLRIWFDRGNGERSTAEELQVDVARGQAAALLPDTQHGSAQPSCQVDLRHHRARATAREVPRRSVLRRVALADAGVRHVRRRGARAAGRHGRHHVRRVCALQGAQVLPLHQGDARRHQLRRPEASRDPVPALRQRAPRVPLAALTQTVGMSDADMHSYIVRAVKQFSMDPSALMS